MRIQRNNSGQITSPSARKIIKLRQRAFNSGGASLELQIPTNYIRDISRKLNYDTTREVARRNLLNWSKDFNNSVWVTQQVTKVFNGTITNPFGVNESYDLIDDAVNVGHTVVQALNIISGQVLTTSVWVHKADHSWFQLALGTTLFGGNVFVNFNFDTGNFGQSGASGTYTKTSLPNGWWKITATATAATSALNNVPVIAGTNNTDSVRVLGYSGSSQKFVTIAACQVEIGSVSTDYQQTQTTNTDDGASLIMTPNTIGEGRLFNCKPELRNLIKFSEEFDNASWNKACSNATPVPVVTANFATDPIGGTTADRVQLTLPGDNEWALVRVLSLSILALQTGSVWMKAADGGQVGKKVNIGTFGAGNFSNTIVVLTADWQRVSTTRTLAQSTNTEFFIGKHRLSNPNGINNADASTDFLLWGAQLELGSTPTIYQRTTDGIIDFQATRATSATVVQKDSTVGDGCYNIFQRSEEFENAIWLSSAPSVTKTANATTAPNGTLTADKITENTSTSEQNLYQQFVGLGTGTYTSSIYAKKAERDFMRMSISDFGANGCAAVFDLNNGIISTSAGASGSVTNVSATITYVTDGWYRCTLTATVAVSSVYGLFYPRSTNSTSSYAGISGFGIYVWGAQLVRGTQPKDYLKTTTRLAVPSIDYSLGSSNPALLVEPATTNSILRSEELDNAYWSKNNVSVVANGATAPSGALTADIISDGTSNAIHYSDAQVSGLTSGQFYTRSAYVKYNGRQWVALSIFDTVNSFFSFDVQNGILGVNTGGAATGFIQSIGNGWYRCSITRQLTGGTIFTAFNLFLNATTSSYTGTNAGVYLWGQQIELGLVATSYIATTTATVTRNAYTSYVDLFNNSLLNKDNFTLYVEGYLYNGSTSNKSVILSDTIGTGANSNEIGFYNQIVPLYSVGGSITVYSFLPVDNNSSYKIAIVRNGTSVKYFINGLLIPFSPSIATFDYRYLAVNNGGSTYNIKNISLWKHTKTDAECLSLTDLGGLNTNLVAYYKLNGNADDATRRSPNGTTTGATFVNGKIGQGASFVNGTDRIDIADFDNYSFTTGGGNDVPFTISMWIYVNSINTNGNWLINKRDASTNDEWQIRIDTSSKIEFAKFSTDSSNFQGIISSTTITIGTWHHIVITDNGSKTNGGMQIYINNVLQTNTNTNGGSYLGMINGTSITRIGLNSWNLTRPDLAHKGLIDEVGIWKNRVLTQAEVTQLYNSGNGLTYTF